MTEDDKARTPLELVGGSYELSSEHASRIQNLLEPVHVEEVRVFMYNALRVPLPRFFEADAGFADFIHGTRERPPHVDSFYIPGVNEHGDPTPPLFLLPEACMCSLSSWGWNQYAVRRGLLTRENLDQHGQLKSSFFTTDPFMRAWGDLIGAWFTKPRLSNLNQDTSPLPAGMPRYVARMKGSLKAAVKRKPKPSEVRAARMLLQGLLLEAPPEPVSRATGGGRRKKKGKNRRGAPARSAPGSRSVVESTDSAVGSAGVTGVARASSLAVEARAHSEVVAVESPSPEEFDWNAHFERLNAGLSRARKAERAAMRAETLPVTRFGGGGDEAAEGGASAPARPLSFPRAPFSEMPGRVQNFVAAMQEPQCVVDGRILRGAIEGFASFFTPERDHGHFVAEEAEGWRLTVHHPNFGTRHLHMPHAPQVVSRDAASERSPWWAIIHALIDLSEE